MSGDVEAHYTGIQHLSDAIAAALRAAGRNLDELTTGDLAPIDEFHIRGRKATLELADRLQLRRDSHVLDIGSGLGGPARTIAEVHGCNVTGIDLTPSFCEAASALSNWVRLQDKVCFQRADATDLPFDDDSFDAAITVHVAMNIPDKPAVYRHARRVLRPGGIFGIYDVLQGEGGEVLFPVPWARDQSISHLATPDEMRSMLAEVGFSVIDEVDSTEESLEWFRGVTASMAASEPPPISFRDFLGEDFPQMARNQVRNLAERRIRTVSFICRA